MLDYRELYFGLYRKVEKAINILIEAQREAEEAHLEDEEPRIIVIPQICSYESNDES